MPSGSCSRRDPMLAAGFRYCGTCGAAAYPRDAAWIGDDLVLASFAALCEHDPEPIACLVAPSALDASPLPRCRVCGAPAGQYPDLCPDCRCQADTWTGARCANHAKDDGLCGVHLAQRRRNEARRVAR